MYETEEIKDQETVRREKKEFCGHKETCKEVAVVRLDCLQRGTSGIVKAECSKEKIKIHFSENP